MEGVRQAVCVQLKGLIFLSKVSGPDVLPGHYFFVILRPFFTRWRSGGQTVKTINNDINTFQSSMEISFDDFIIPPLTK